MNADEARRLCNEPWYIKQIRQVCMSIDAPRHTTLEFVDRKDAEKAKDELKLLGYAVGKIKEYNNRHGDDFTMEVGWLNAY